MIIRCVNIIQIAAIALFFSLVTWNNVIDFNSNWLFVHHVLSMDTTFKSPVLMPRAIQQAATQQWLYYSIIAWEGITAVVCWLGTVALLKHLKSSTTEYQAAKNTAYVGLLMGFVLYMIGFIVIGGEWFVMWQSQIWNGQMKAGLFVSLILFVLISLQITESPRQESALK